MSEPNNHDNLLKALVVTTIIIQIALWLSGNYN